MIPRMLAAFISAIFAVLTVQVVQESDVKSELKQGWYTREETIVKRYQNKEEDRLD